MPRFKLLASQHTGEKGEIYQKGQVIETEVELDKLFKNRFKRIGAAAGAKPPKPQDTDDRINQGGGRQGDKPLVTRLAKQRAAAERMGTRRETRPADEKTAKATPANTDYEEEEDETEEEEETTPAHDEDDDPENVVTVADDEDDEGEGEGSLGEDVTEQFPKAAPAEMKVFKKDRSYIITEEDDPANILTPEPLPSKRAVDEFIKEKKAR